MPISSNSKEAKTRELGIDVYEAAKQRIHRMIDTHDCLRVSFSGGKDSLVVLHLVKEVYEERGIKTPILVGFWDEELIPTAVIDFVDSYRQRDWINMTWLCIPLKSSKYILGKTFDYIQWDPTREWVRQKPDWSIQKLIIHGVIQEGVMSQYTLNEYFAQSFRGKAIHLTGIRAQESLFRYRAILNNRNETAVARTESPRINLGRPIYDWTEDDIFYYLYTRGIPFCDIYNQQSMNGEQLRVATPLHAEAAKRLWVLRSRDPDFYERILKVFPEVAVQEKYYHDMDHKQKIEGYPMTMEGIERYIRDNITDFDQQQLALKRFVSVRRRMVNSPDSYTPEYVFGCFVSGAFKREILPGPKRKVPV